MTYNSAEDRRKHNRILLPEHQFLHCKGVDPKFEGKVTVIGSGGLFVRTKQAMTMGQTIYLKVEDPNLNLEAEAKVRDVNEKGVGVEFANLDAPTQRKLQDFLRNIRP